MGELPVELAGDVALEAPPDFSRGLSLCGASVDVGAGSGTASYPGQCDGVDGAVQGPVTTTVEPVPNDPATAGLDRVGAAQGRERSLVAASAWVGEADDGLSGADRADPVPVGETGGEVVDDGQELSAIGLQLAPGLLQRERETLNLSLANGKVATGRGRQLASGQTGQRRVGQRRVGQRAAGCPAVGVVAGQQRARSRLVCAVLTAVSS